MFVLVGNLCDLNDRRQIECGTGEDFPAIWQQGGTLPSRASLRGTTVFLKRIKVNRLVATKEVLIEFRQVYLSAFRSLLSLDGKIGLDGLRLDQMVAVEWCVRKATSELRQIALTFSTYLLTTFLRIFKANYLSCCPSSNVDSNPSLLFRFWFLPILSLLLSPLFQIRSGLNPINWGGGGSAPCLRTPRPLIAHLLTHQLLWKFDSDGSDFFELYLFLQHHIVSDFDKKNISKFVKTSF